MVKLLPRYNITLENAQDAYLQLQGQYRRQAIVAAPGLGKSVFGKTQREIGLDATSYVFSDNAKKFKERHPDAAREIAEAMALGNMIPPRIVEQQYREDLSDIGFGIDAKLQAGTVSYDGFPRFAGDSTGNQVRILQKVHGINKPVFGLTTILHHDNDYIPTGRQLLRELHGIYSTGQIQREDTLRAPSRVIGYNKALPELEEGLHDVSGRLLSFKADDTTPKQNALLYLTMATTDLDEEEIRASKEFERLGGKEFQFPSLQTALADMKRGSIVTDAEVQKRAELVEDLLHFTLGNEVDKAPFDSFSKLFDSYVTDRLER